MVRILRYCTPARLGRGFLSGVSRRLLPGRLIAGVSVLSLALLSFFLGAAVMYFQLPSSDYLRKAFVGARAWQERRRSAAAPESADGGSEWAAVVADDPERTWDGFTLYTTTHGARATLIDMRGNVVHRWEMPFSKAWPSPPHVARPLPDHRIHWFRCHLYPNGDLLAIYHAEGDTPYGYGLAKLDKDSNLLWTYSRNVHHDLDVGENGEIYTLTQRNLLTRPDGLDYIPSPFTTDYLVVLSPEGKELDKPLPILEAFRDSPYASTLDSIDRLIREEARARKSDPPRAARFASTGVLPPRGRLVSEGDILHANSVKVLRRALAPRFPLFKAGQVLTSLRNLDTLAVLDTKTRGVTWAAQGIWQAQHDPEFLESGRLLVYDNLGPFDRSRIIEYDPVTQATPWVYSHEAANPFFADARGMKQRLPNGNTLIVDPEHSRLLEVTRSKELVWEWVCRLPLVEMDKHTSMRSGITGARRYRLDHLAFLKGVARARP
jgi:hypothetical protein